MYYDLLNKQPQQLRVSSVISVYRLALAMKPSVLETVYRSFWMALSFAGI